jgi:hypothetical protein
LSEDFIVSFAPESSVFAKTAEKNVIVCISIQLVIAVTTPKNIDAGTTIQFVFSGTAAKEIIVIASIELVVALSS